MSRGPGAVDQQKWRAFAHPLHMPADAGRFNERTGIPVGPICTIAVPDETGHGSAYPSGADGTPARNAS